MTLGYPQRQQPRQCFVNRLSIFVISIVLVALLGTSVQAYPPPTYRLLGTPQFYGGPHAPPPPPAAYGQRLPAARYSYGWFGAKPRRHWTSHYGYYRQYREWSGR